MGGNGYEREWGWEGMGMCLWENNGDGNKFLAGLRMGLRLMEMGRNGKAESDSRTPLHRC